MMRAHASRLRAIASVTTLACLTAIAVPRGAAAQTKTECLASFDHGQVLRQEMKLRAARDEFRSCARDACSPPVRKDCLEFLDAIARDMPTLVVGARGPDGADVPAVAVSIDGERVGGAAGAPIDVDPGKHELRFEHAPWAPITQTLIARAGERNRLVVVSFVDGERAAPKAERTETHSLSPWPIVTASVGAVALGSFAFFGISGVVKRDDLESSCAPDCSNDAMSSVRTRFIVADVSLGIAIVSLAATAVLLFGGRSAKTARRSDGPAHFFARSF